MNRPRGSLFLLAVVLSLVAAHRSPAQVAVYKLHFEQVGLSVNYRSFDGGYFAMPFSGGAVSFVFLVNDGSGPQFVRSGDLGIYFEAADGSAQRGVLANADSTGTPVNFITAVGKLDQTVRATVVSTGPPSTATTVSARLPKKLSGYVLTADDTGSGLFDGGAGSAGASTLVATLDAARTNEANRRGLSVEEVVDELVAQLQRAGYTESAASSSTSTSAATAGPAQTTVDP